MTQMIKTVKLLTNEGINAFHGVKVINGKTKATYPGMIKTSSGKSILLTRAANDDRNPKNFQVLFRNIDESQLRLAPSTFKLHDAIMIEFTNQNHYKERDPKYTVQLAIEDYLAAQGKAVNKDSIQNAADTLR